MIFAKVLLGVLIVGVAGFVMIGLAVTFKELFGSLDNDYSDEI